MGKIKSWVRIFFGFSRTETNGFLILLPLMVVILFSEPLYRWYYSSRPEDFSVDAKALDSLMARLHWKIKDTVAVGQASLDSIRFSPFDPNTATEKEFKQVGLSDFLTKRILRYREKGGRFRRKEDVLNIYGMDSSWYNQAQAWMVVAYKAKSPTRTKLKDTLRIVQDINQADSLQLLKIYGVGPVLSKRILTFRDRLGGFVSLDQLKEVYGLDTTVIKVLRKKFKVMEGFVPRQIHLNTATLEDLTRHPYIRRKEAQSILSYRMQHGEFTAIDQLVDIKLLTAEWINRATPYLTLDK